ncbi:bifunctional glutamine-synthetase adenylyltransferase/deadenyltransferase, partial [Sesbania bispinosa]
GKESIVKETIVTQENNKLPRARVLPDWKLISCINIRRTSQAWTICLATHYSHYHHSLWSKDFHY